MSGFQRGAHGAFGKLETLSLVSILGTLVETVKKKNRISVHKNKGDRREESSCLLWQEVWPCKSAHVVWMAG